MKIETFLEKIGNLIGKDELNKAIQELHTLLKKSPLLDELILQSARYNDIIKQIRMGLLDFEQANITKNKIRYALLDLLREIETNLETNSELKKELENIYEGKMNKSNIISILGDKNIIVNDINGSLKIIINTK